MSQTLISQFYNTRKRAAEGIANSNIKSKVLILDCEDKLLGSEHSAYAIKVTSEGNHEDSCSVLKEDPSNTLGGKTSLIYKAGSVDSSKSNLPVKVCKKISTRAVRIKVSEATNIRSVDKSQEDIRSAFKPKVVNKCVTNENLEEFSEAQNDNTGDKVVPNDRSSKSDNRIVFELLGGLSPKKKEVKDHELPRRSETNQNSMYVKNARSELGLMTPKKNTEQRSKDISFDDIRSKLTRSSRLTELQKSLKRFNEKDNQLKDHQLQRKKLESSSPQLKKFTSIDFEVPVSPQKIPTSISSSSSIQSPLKKTPTKSVLASPSKAPAYQRLAHLSQPGVPSLTLPFSYRILEEIFRCMDTVASMMYNRKESVTFDKLKSGVQQMLRRNFTELHLGQVKSVLPNAFAFSQEKVVSGISTKKNKYQLVILPIIDFQEDVQKVANSSSYSMMTPSLLVKRLECFHKNLLEIVKDHHEKFLKTLGLPDICRASLARWHPEFDLERVPPVSPAELPAAPVEDKACTAQDVLDRAKTLFGCNQRMEKALQMVSEQMSKSARIISSQGTNKINSNSSLLKGIPKALLEKVRAKQAAKALVVMTRSPAEDQEAMQLLRLPEIARILRNIFVAEKKNVLLLEVALEKLSDSYREALTCGELELHIHLLMKVVPGWVQILHVRKTNYLKVAKDADMSAVMKKLEKCAAEKNSI